MNVFTASVQYNDLKGSAAADDADNTDAKKWLSDNGHINADEYVLGIKMWAGENHGSHNDPVSVTFLVSELNGYDNIPDMINGSAQPLQLKEINVDMNIADFLALFKRFAIAISPAGLLNDKTYTV